MSLENLAIILLPLNQLTIELMQDRIQKLKVQIEALQQKTPILEFSCFDQEFRATSAVNDQT